MPLETREELVEGYLAHMVVRNLLNPPETLEEANRQLQIDTSIIATLENTRYIHGRGRRLPKAGNMHLAWEYAQDERDHHRFLKMLRISPKSFDFLLSLIENHPVFTNSSNVPQAPVDVQLAVTLYRMGHYGNSASVTEVARMAGCSEGSVENYTDQCMKAIESLQDQFVRRLTPEEKEVEKVWIEQHLGFSGGTWREGWLMYDGTIVVLFKKPGQNGDAYFTRKGNYGLNVQIGNAPSNLRIVDFSHGLTGAAHDAEAFKHTCASVYPDWLFEGEEFAWVDSAYPCTLRTMPVHKEPASLEPRNAIFDRYVSRIRVRSEHCMGALKGRFQSLRGLRIPINSNNDHMQALRWITCAIILHNLVIDVEGGDAGGEFGEEHTHIEEEEDCGGRHPLRTESQFDTGEEKRQTLIDELMDYRRQKYAGS